MFGRRAGHLALRRALLSGRLVLAVSTPVLLEYEEVITRSSGASRWADVVLFLELLAALHGSVRRVHPTYRFRSIPGDPDDDAFADCAIVADADWLITSDRHMYALQGSGFRPQPISPEEFITRFLPEP